MVSLAKVLDLFFWHPILVFALVTGYYLVSLFLLQVGIQGYVGKSGTTLAGHLGGKMAGRIFSLLSFDL
jgi:membrane associated rhomboid family serine protease